MADFARGERLRQLREARHLSQEDAAHELGVSTKTIRSWEKGSGIRWRNAEALGSFYDVDPETIIEREGHDNGSPPTRDELDHLSQSDAAELRSAVEQLRRALDETRVELLAAIGEVRAVQEAQASTRLAGGRRGESSES